MKFKIKSAWNAVLTMDHSVHLWRMGLFGLVSAIPLAFLVSVVTFWLTDHGCSPGHIGFMSWMMVPYSLKIFLGPIIQMTSFGFLGRRVGHYRIWIVFSQLGVVSCLYLLRFIHPLQQIETALALCFSIALFGAMQDCALEGYRIHSTPEDQQSAVSGANSMGYRIGLWGTTCIALISSYYDWFFAFFCISGWLVLTSIVCLWRLPQPKSWKEQFSAAQYVRLLIQGWRFFQNTYYFSSVLLMIGAQKLGDVFLRSVWSHYFIKVGYTKQHIVTIDKGFGIIATIIGIRLGVAWIERKGLASGFRFWAILQGAMALLFVAHACFDRQHFGLFFASVSANHLVGGIGNVTILTYLSQLCKGSDQKDTLRYAMVSSLGSFGRTLVSYFSCIVADFIPFWWMFFVICALMCLPAFGLSYSQKPFKKRILNPKG
ncbi:MAG: AmpG family muropeptide MFS transporter [Alphaproteobacteria bacterium]|nr:AmpG family muropeptide MFS transporter [Alphaproteobacteria bacterium]